MPGKAIILRPIPVPDAAAAQQPSRFRALFQGFRKGQKVTVEFWAQPAPLKDPPAQSVKIGQAVGTLNTAVGSLPETQALQLTPEGAAPAQKKDTPQIGIVFDPTADKPAWMFDLPAERAGCDAGDTWTIEARIAAYELRSPAFPVSHLRRVSPARFAPTRQATYDWHAGNDLILYNDASVDSTGTSGAFADIRAAIQHAEHFIFIVDWSFQPMMRLDRSKKDLWATIGGLLIVKAQRHPDLLIAIHTWTHASAAADSQNNDARDILDRMAKEMGYAGGRPKNLLVRTSDRKGYLWSHHQKFIVLDSACADQAGRREVKAFFGGLDMTKGRFDWPEHPIMSDEASAKDLTTEVILTERHRIRSNVPVGYDDWYNAEFTGAENERTPGAPNPKIDFQRPREPWHDIYGQITGPAAWDIAREFVGRWQCEAGGLTGDGLETAQKVADKLLKEMMVWKKPAQSGAPSTPKSPDFVQQWEPRSGPWAAQVLRSQVQDHWHHPLPNPQWSGARQEFAWALPTAFERSIQDTYLKMIAQAEKYIYIETQYFCGDGTDNGIPDAVANRVAAKIRKKEPFHLYLLMPMYPEGQPDGSKMTVSTNGAVRRGEWQAIARVVRAIENALGGSAPEDAWKDYFTLGYLAQSRGALGGKPWTLGDCLKAGYKEKEARAALLIHNRRHMIYIHSKLMLVDDNCLILGSANLNKRSVAGDRDSEICVALWPSAPRHRETCEAAIADLRHRLWAEHLGRDASGVDPVTGGSTEFQKVAAENRKCFDAGEDNTGKGHFMQWDLHYDRATGQLQFPAAAAHIPDGLDNDSWLWSPDDTIYDWLHL